MGAVPLNLLFLHMIHYCLLCIKQMVHKGLVLVNKTKNKVRYCTTICSDSNEKQTIAKAIGHKSVIHVITFHNLKYEAL